MKWIEPDWPAPARVRALSTTRDGGVSQGVFAGLNLGAHVGDEVARVEANRARLQQAAQIPGSLNWLNQVHGTAVHQVSNQYDVVPDADAACAHEAGLACIVMTADCLPLLLCDKAGTQVAAVHAGWRGLCDGVIEATLAHFTKPAEVLVYLGPAISQSAFEVGPEVRAAFISHSAQAEQAFISGNNNKWQADLYLLAKQRLQACGVQHIYGGQYCTYQQTELFFSYRRDGQTGRMASSIWLA